MRIQRTKCHLTELLNTANCIQTVVPMCISTVYCWEMKKVVSTLIPARKTDKEFRCFPPIDVYLIWSCDLSPHDLIPVRFTENYWIAIKFISGLFLPLAHLFGISSLLCISSMTSDKKPWSWLPTVCMDVLGSPSHGSTPSHWQLL